MIERDIKKVKDHSYESLVLRMKEWWTFVEIERDMRKSGGLLLRLKEIEENGKRLWIK